MSGTEIDPEIARRILYIDDELVVLDKPPGLSVHRAPGAGVTLEPWLAALGHPGSRAELAHRLDRDTSGCLVLGRTKPALRRLGKLFQDGLVEKRYWAVVAGAPDREAGTVEIGIARVRRERLALSVADPGGQKAATRFRVLGRTTAGEARAWLELAPLTGRTHQLRVHCAWAGWPIVADPYYGRPGRPGERLHLHARAIVIPYRHAAPLSILAPPPRHMIAALEACGWTAPKTHASGIRSDAGDAPSRPAHGAQVLE